MKQKIEEHLQRIDGEMASIREILMSEEFAKSIGGTNEDTVGVPPLHKKHLGKVALVVGHTSRAGGAHSSHFKMNEYKFYRNFMGPKIMNALLDLRIESKMFFRDNGGYRQAYKDVIDWDADIVIELHFNAFNGKASGTEILLANNHDDPGLFEKEFAQDMVDKISGVLGISNRGLKFRPKEKGERGWHLVNQTRSIPSILIEPFFGDNENDCREVSNNLTSFTAAISLPCHTYLTGGYRG